MPPLSGPLGTGTAAESWLTHPRDFDLGRIRSWVTMLSRLRHSAVNGMHTFTGDDVMKIHVRYCSV